MSLAGLPPLVDSGTQLLILGSFPGVASLTRQQYYAHPRNLFWPLLADLLGRPLVDLPYAQRLQALQDAHIGVWDVYASCRREGSLDSAIREAVPNDLRGLVARLPALAGIAHNGAASAREMRVTGTLGLPVWRLPSTSPANAGQSRAHKRAAWAAALQACGIAVRPPADAGAPPALR
ncbi:MAG: hypothetical protein RLY78_55 [Pseudomonadota bacterium]|jgi:hypoxanthine-DNA glycosylase